MSGRTVPVFPLPDHLLSNINTNYRTRKETKMNAEKYMSTYSRNKNIRIKAKIKRIIIIHFKYSRDNDNPKNILTSGGK